jgi:hypothetical protein
MAKVSLPVKVLQNIDCTRLGMNTAGEAIVTCPALPRQGDNSVAYQTFLINGREFSNYVRAVGAINKLGLIKPNDLTAIRDTLTAQAFATGNVHQTYIRVAILPGNILVQLTPTKLVDIKPGQWTVRNIAPDDPRLIWRGGMHELPTPQQPDENTRDNFLRLLNLTDNSKILFIASLLSAFQDGAKPITNIVGPAGVGKSTSMLAARGLFDPHEAGLTGPPDKAETLDLVAANKAMICLDNENHCQPWLNNALCRIATGGSSEKRQMYSGDDVNYKSAKRSIWISGLSDYSGRGDFISRAFILHSQIEFAPFDKRRISECDWHERYESIRPQMLGLLYNTLATGLENYPHLGDMALPRMGESYKWLVACEPALFESGTFEKAISHSMREGVEIILTTPVAAAIIALLDKQSKFEGSATELFKAATNALGNLPSKYPRNAKHFCTKLAKIINDLRGFGIKVERKETNVCTRYILEKVSTQPIAA